MDLQIRYTWFSNSVLSKSSPKKIFSQTSFSDDVSNPFPLSSISEILILQTPVATKSDHQNFPAPKDKTSDELDCDHKHNDNPKYCDLFFHSSHSEDGAENHVGVSVLQYIMPGVRMTGLS